MIYEHFVSGEKYNRESGQQKNQREANVSGLGVRTNLP